MVETLHLRAENHKEVEQAAEILRRGGLVAFPTETVYGLGADAVSSKAVEGIFRAKGRPSWDPLIVHVPDLEAVSAVAVLSGQQQRRAMALAGAFWPGPLTMLLPRTDAIPDLVTAGRSLVGVRVPSHPAALALLRLAKTPLAAPSANRFGHTSPTTAQHVIDDLDGRIAAVLDGGPCAVGVESTVVDVSCTPMVVYRAGAVSVAAIREQTGVETCLFTANPETQRETAEPGSLPSPGVGLRHYAPDVAVQLTAGNPRALWSAVHAAQPGVGRVGVLLPTDWPIEVASEKMIVQPWGGWQDPAALAASLFAGLRGLEQSGVSLIVCPLPPGGGGLNDAVRDRLIKAAQPR